MLQGRATTVLVVATVGMVACGEVVGGRSRGTKRVRRLKLVLNVNVPGQGEGALKTFAAAVQELLPRALREATPLAAAPQIDAGTA